MPRHHTVEAPHTTHRLSTTQTPRWPASPLPPPSSRPPAITAGACQPCPRRPAGPAVPASRRCRSRSTPIPPLCAPRPEPPPPPSHPPPSPPLPRPSPPPPPPTAPPPPPPPTRHDHTTPPRARQAFSHATFPVKRVPNTFLVNWGRESATLSCESFQLVKARFCSSSTTFVERHTLSELFLFWGTRELRHSTKFISRWWQAQVHGAATAARHVCAGVHRDCVFQRQQHPARPGQLRQASRILPATSSTS